MMNLQHGAVNRTNCGYFEKPSVLQQNKASTQDASRLLPVEELVHREPEAANDLEHRMQPGAVLSALDLREVAVPEPRHGAETTQGQPLLGAHLFESSNELF